VLLIRANITNDDEISLYTAKLSVAAGDSRITTASIYTADELVLTTSSKDANGNVK
jgi:hypothetical protein